MNELVKLVEEIYRQGAKDHSDQTKGSKEEYFKLMADKILRTIS